MDVIKVKKKLNTKKKILGLFKIKFLKMTDWNEVATVKTVKIVEAAKKLIKIIVLRTSNKNSCNTYLKTAFQVSLILGKVNIQHSDFSFFFLKYHHFGF